MKNETLRSKVDEEKARILHEVVKLEECGALPLDFRRGEECISESANGLRKQIDELLDSDLVIAVCGSVKAGKSTFLNSILFGDNILPVFDTPCTAKLTFIRHTDGPQTFLAEFYTKEEFSAMREKMSPDVLLELDRRANASAQKFSPGTKWGKSDEGTLEDGFAGLSKYVSQDGLYVPFVKQVTLNICRPELKGLVIVDTPGLNDPNPLNSFVTAEWAVKAHAVVYLTTWKGLDQVDVDFISENFGKLQEESKNRLFVINKIDQNEGWTGTLKKFREDFPLEKKNICGYSSYISLLRSLDEHGALNNEDLEDWLSQRSDFNCDPGNVRDMIRSRLCTGDVEIRLEKCKNLVDRCYKLALEKLNLEMADIRVTIDACQRTADEVDRKISDLHECRRNFESIANIVFTQCQNEIVGIGDVQQRAKNALIEIRRIVGKEFEKCRNDAMIIPCVKNAVAMANMELKVRFDGVLEGYVDTVFQRMKAAQRKLRKPIEETGCEDEIIEPSLAVVGEEKSRSIANLRAEVDIDSVLNDIHWYHKTATNAFAAMSAITTSFEGCFRCIDLKVTEFTKVCHKELKSYVDEVKASVESSIDKMEKAQKAEPKDKLKLLEESKKSCAKKAILRKKIEEAHVACHL